MRSLSIWYGSGCTIVFGWLSMDVVGWNASSYISTKQLIYNLEEHETDTVQLFWIHFTSMRFDQVHDSESIMV